MLGHKSFRMTQRYLHIADALHEATAAVADAPAFALAVGSSLPPARRSPRG